jgi:hypothetical protein
MIYDITRKDLLAMKRFCPCPHVKIALAYYENRGVRLSAEEIEEFVRDGAAFRDHLHNIKSDMEDAKGGDAK